MNIEKFIYNKWSAIVMTLLSALVMLFTPYSYYDNVMAILVLIGMALLLKWKPTFLTLMKTLILFVAVCSSYACVVFIANAPWKALWQYEYLSLILILPYLIITVNRLSGAKPTKFELISFGGIALLGIYVKPIFIFIPIFFELWTRVLGAFPSGNQLSGLQPLNFASDTTARRETILLMILVSLNGLVASLPAIVNELNLQFWPLLFSWVAVVLTLQALVLYATLKWIDNPRIHLVLIVILIMINLNALYLSLLTDFLVQPEIIRIPVIAFLGFGLIALVGMVGKRVVPMRVVNFILVMTMLASVVGLRFLMPAEVSVNAEQMSPFSGIMFHTKPNIHIVSFDALGPTTLIKKHLKLASVPYERILNGEGRIIFKNSFASHVATKASLNSLMRLAHADFKGENFFTGQEESPVTHILRANGYKVSTGFDIPSYFGKKGKFVDSYDFPERLSVYENTVLCRWSSLNDLMFFGFCALEAFFMTHGESWSNQVIDIIQKSGATSDSKPNFTFHYITYPQHTGRNFKSTNHQALLHYSSHYYKNSNKVVQIIKQLEETIRNDKVLSILFIMGDHGPYVSRTITVDEDETFVVQDRHGIAAVILVNETDCTEKELRHYTTSYATPARILAGIMRCLAYDPVRLDRAMNFSESYSFKTFLYE